MIAFPGMLVTAAKNAGMKVPKDPDNFDASRYPHFSVFCAVQLCRRMRPGEHFENAEIIARIPNDKIQTVTLTDLLAKGLIFATG